MSDAAHLPAAPADRRRYDVDSQRAVASVRAPSLAVGVVVASGIALVLGLIRLGTPSLWFDEAFTADAVHRSPEWWVDNDQYHVLYDSVARAWTSLAGTSEWALRLPSVFGAMAACALLVVLARKVFDGWVALVSGILLATSPFLVKWSQQARGYTLLLAVSLVATLASCARSSAARAARGLCTDLRSAPRLSGTPSPACSSYLRTSSSSRSDDRSSCPTARSRRSSSSPSPFRGRRRSRCDPRAQVWV